MSEHVMPTTQKSRYHSLVDMVSQDDNLGIAIVAAPDTIASTLSTFFLTKKSSTLHSVAG